MKIVVKTSSKSGKRLMAIFDEKKTVHFGVEKPKIETFIDTGDKT